MNADQIRKWLALLGESPVDVGEGWMNTHCPMAPWSHERGTDRTASFGIRIEPGDSQVNCFACPEGRGRQTDLLIRLAGRLRGEAHSIDLRAAMKMIVDVEEGGEALELEWAERAGPKVDEPFDEGWLARFPPAYHEGQVHPYLELRGVPYAVADRMDFRYMINEDRVCVPVRNWAGELVGFHGRAVVSFVEPAYRMIKCRGLKNPLAWLGEHWVDPGCPVVMAESVFDLARVLQVYRNAVCPLSASMGGHKVERMSRCMEVVTYFDAGMAGDHARRKVATILRDRPVVHVVPTAKDPGEMQPWQVARQLEGVVELDVLLT